MMHKYPYIITILIFCLQTSADGQIEKYLDKMDQEFIDYARSQEKLAEEAQSPLEKIKIYEALGIKSMDNNDYLAVDYLRKAISFNKEYNSDSIKYNLYEKISVRLINIAALEEAEEKLAESYHYYHQLKDTINYSKVLILQGFLQSRTGNLDKSQELLSASYHLNKLIGNRLGYQDCLNRMGINYGMMGLMDKALECYENIRKDNLNQPTKYFQRASVYNSATAYYKKGDRESAKKLHSEVVELRKNTKSVRSQAYSYDGQAMIEHLNKKNKNAMALADTAILLFEKAGILYNVAYTSIFKSKILLETNKISEARSTLLKAMDAAITSNALDLKAEIHLILFQIENDNNNYKKALEHYLAHDAITDSLTISSSKYKLEDLEQKLEEEKSKREIQSLNNQYKLQEVNLNKSKAQRNYLIALIAALFSLALFLYYAFWERKQINKALLSKNKEIHNSLEERELLIKEIHHRVKNNLQVISSMLHLQARKLSGTSKSLLMESRNRIKSMALVHEKLYKEKNVQNIDLLDYTTDLINSLNKTYKVDTDRIKTIIICENINLDLDSIIPLGIIINELYTNCLKYAFPNGRVGKIELLFNSNGKLSFSIKDNGIGI